MNSQTFEEISTRFSRACRWIEQEIGRPVGTRFREAERILRDLTAVHASGQISLPEHNQLRIHATEIWQDVLPVLDIYSAFGSGSSRPPIVSRLSISIEGPTFSRNENPSTANPRGRNFLFELVFAALLSNVGLDLTNSDLEDGAFDFNGTTLYSACKRPQSESGIHRGCKDARKQLNRRLHLESASSVGIIALDISKVVHRGTQIVMVPNRESALRVLDHQNTIALEQCRQEILSRLSPNILGVASYCSICADIGGVLTFGSFWTAIDNPRSSRPDIWNSIAIAANRLAY